MQAPVASVIIRAEVGGRKGGWIQGHSQASLAQSGCLVIYISPLPFTFHQNCFLSLQRDQCIIPNRGGCLLPTSLRRLRRYFASSKPSSTISQTTQSDFKPSYGQAQGRLHIQGGEGSTMVRRQLKRRVLALAQLPPPPPASVIPNKHAGALCQI